MHPTDLYLSVADQFDHTKTQTQDIFPHTFPLAFYQSDNWQMVYLASANLYSKLKHTGIL